LTNDKHKISIALCTYNGARFIIQQLESFFAQTRLPDELVICDDRSSDATVDIIKDFISNLPIPVHLRVNEQNLGSTKNFERAISLCTGDLIFLADQDDVWFPNKLGRFAAEFDKSENVGMVFSNAELVGENLEPLKHNLWDFSFTAKERRKAKNGKMFEVLLRRNVVTGATMAFRTSFREVFLPIPTNIPNTIHDAWIALTIAANAKVVFLEESSIFYRQHAAQQLGIDWKDKEKNRSGTKKITRRQRYDESIGSGRKDVERLVKFSQVAKFYPQFQTQAATTLINQLIGSFMEETEERIRHYEARKNLASEKSKRLAPIVREVLTGRYNRFSKGLLSAAKDVLENW
jgi:glycosyltransferase involved in cell wall biosynthesis